MPQPGLCLKEVRAEEREEAVNREREKAARGAEDSSARRGLLNGNSDFLFEKQLFSGPAPQLLPTVPKPRLAGMRSSHR